MLFTSRVRSLSAYVLSLGALQMIPPAMAQVNVTTQHNDNSRTGQNVQETILAPSNVTQAQFGKLFSVEVDGAVYAQPLYLSNVRINGASHNVIYVATEHNVLYAMDADNGMILWSVTLSPAGAVPLNWSTDFSAAVAAQNSVQHNNLPLWCSNLTPEIGITGTPVIDVNTNTIYLVTATHESSSWVQRLHAVDAITHAEKFGGPVVITAPAGFNALLELQRSGLLFQNGHVIVAWAANCDTPAWHGWVISYNAATLAQEAIFNTVPNALNPNISLGGPGGGVWMSGAGPAADSAGNTYFAAGNGDWDGLHDFADSIIKLGPPAGGSFPLADWFTPLMHAALDNGDGDMGSGGVLLLPQLPNTSHPNLLVHAGKDAVIRLVDRNHMGGLESPASSTVQSVPVKEGLWGMPAYWNNTVYVCATDDHSGVPSPLQAFKLSGGQLSAPPAATGNTYGYPCAPPSISANGTANGIVWTVEQVKTDTNNEYPGSPGAAVLHAHAAANVASPELYNSNQAAAGRDAPVGGVKFAVPTIANGKVYFGTATGPQNLCSLDKPPSCGSLPNRGIATPPQVQPPNYGMWSSGFLNVYGLSVAVPRLGRAVTSLIDTIDGDNIETYYVGNDRHVHQFYFAGGRWRNVDLTSNAGSGQVQAASNSGMTSLIDTVRRAPQVYYVGLDQHIYQLYFDAGAWHNVELTTRSGGVPAASGSGLASLLDTVNGDATEVYYVGNDQHVHQLYFSNPSPGWRDVDLSLNSGAKAAVAPAGNLSALLDTVNGNHVEVYYVGSPDGNVHQLYYAGGPAWIDIPLTSTSGVTSFLSGISSVIDSINGNSIETCYIGSDQHVYQLYFLAGGWHNVDLSVDSGTEVKAASASGVTSLLDTVRNNIQVYYVGLDQHVYQLYFDAGAWHNLDLTRTGGGVSAAPGTGLASLLDKVNGNNTEIYYIGLDQQVHQLYFSGAWHDVKL